MKNFYFIILLVCISNTAFSQSGWFKQTPHGLPFSGSFSRLQMVSENIIYGNGFAKSTDAGFNWYYPHIGIAAHYFNQNEGIGIRQNIAYKTSNGGENWVMLGSVANSSWFDFAFPSQMTGFTAGVEHISRTTNGGLNWSSIYFSAATQFNALKFVNINTGYAVTQSGQILKTVNGGTNWVISTTVTGALKDVECAGFSVVVAVATTSGLVVRSTDSGLSWSTQSIGQGGTIANITFADENTGYLVKGGSVSAGWVWKTTDAGATWNRVADLQSVGTAISFINANTGVAGTGGLWGLEKTTNGGINWNKIVNPGATQKTLWDVQILSNTVAVAVGDTSIIIRTSDAGLTWSMIPNPLSATGSLQRVCFSTPNTGWAVGTPNKILKTTDGGLTWVRKYIGFDNNANVYGVSFIDDNTGIIIAGQNKTFMKTTNGGLTWFAISAGFEVWDIQMVDKDNVFAVGYGVWRSSNGGITWEYMDTGNLGYSRVKFFNANTGVIMDNRRTEKTTDGGLTWRKQTFPDTLISYQDMDFSDLNHGTVVGDSCTVLRTTNGGENWVKQDTRMKVNRLRAVSFLNNNTGIVGGDFGLIFRTNTGGIGEMTTVEPVTSEIPSGYKLHQNYPNPFNPSTTIKFEVPASGLVKLKIYDMLGKEVQVLINESMTAGVYEYNFEAGGLRSGVYFYRLETENHSEVKKMVVLN
jgi:photosystem II stability/assembly factor-like uncharacterized protein